MTLRPCSRCDRHVRPDGPCPFCGGAISPGPERGPRVVRQVTRALLFYGGATLGACGTPPPEPPPPAPTLEVAMEPLETQPPEAAPPRPPVSPPRAVDPGSVDESPSVSREERAHAESRKHSRQRRVHVDHSCCPPYGAPPVPTLV
ncbi:MAG: hypothetical protein EVA89_10390 [Sandaracinaceae bacterium]|nr:MAG: hypothetical protein EVA89_10390 [Sandaracinaceae bacterium]